MRRREFTTSVVVTGYKGTVTTKCEEKTVYFLHGGDWVEGESDHEV